MREYLFRGKRLDNGEWVFGNLFQHKNGSCEIFQIENVVFAGKVLEGRWYKVYIDTVCQCTGLTDKNGVKIFENDIVKTKYGRECIVGWLHGRAMFDLDPRQNARNAKTKAPDDFDLWRSENLEVVGNVYDMCGAKEGREEGGIIGGLLG